MQRWTSRRQPRFIAEINLVPFMDLIFMLLFVFMLIAPMMKSEPARSETAHGVPADSLVLEVLSPDELSLDGRKLNLSGLQKAVQELLIARPGAGVIIKLPGTLPVQTVVKITDELRAAGVEKTALHALTSGK